MVLNAKSNFRWKWKSGWVNRRIDVVVEKSGDERLIVQNACEYGIRL